MRIFRVAVLAVVVVLVWAALAIAQEAEAVPGVDETVMDGLIEDVWDDWYGLVEGQVGMLWNIEREGWAPYLAVPVLGYREITGILGAEFDFDEKTEDKGVVAAVGGVTYHVGTLKDFGIDLPGAEHVGLNVGYGGRYDFDTQEFEQTAILSILDLSFGNGNVDKQRDR